MKPIRPVYRELTLSTVWFWMFLGSASLLAAVSEPLPPVQPKASVDSKFPQIMIVVHPDASLSDRWPDRTRPATRDIPTFYRHWYDLGVSKVEPFYPGVLKNPILRAAIECIYILTLESSADPPAVLAKLVQDPHISLASRRTPHELHYVPNDPRHLDQWHLQHTRVYEAWDTVGGEIAVNSVIAIVDAGIFWEHPDLAANMWINSGEDVNQNGEFDPADLNGVDDDGNGFVDDVVGWDFGDNDYDPAEDSIIHGTPVAGAASEVTDNGLLGAAIGFAARLMAVKCFDQSGQFGDAYQGMVYAVDNGAAVVNCAWGTLTPNAVEQFIIDTLWAADALVVASAGAVDGVAMYPAAYEHVLAVTATGPDDVKASFANFGTWVDVSAPGVNIWTTSENDEFDIYSGTSFATALTAGLAGLIRAWDPSLTADQTAGLIQSAAVDIDDLNPSYAGYLGTGRIDCAAWLPVSSTPGDAEMDAAFTDLQNSPNPFNATTVITYEMQHPGYVRLQVFDLGGSRVANLVAGWQDRGMQSVVWDAAELASGAYFYELEVAGQVVHRKCLLVK